MKRAAPSGGPDKSGATSQKSARSDAQELSQSDLHASSTVQQTASRRRSFVLPALAACQSLTGHSERSELSAPDGCATWALPLPPPSFASVGAQDQLGDRVSGGQAVATRSPSSSVRPTGERFRTPTQTRSLEAGSESAEQVATDGKAAGADDVLRMPRRTGTRRSSFGCGRISLHLADQPNWAGNLVDSDAVQKPSFEQQLKAHSRKCLQQAVAKLSPSMADGLDGMQQFLVEACEVSDRAIDCASDDEHLSDSSVNRSSSPVQPLNDATFFRWLNITLARESRQWESLLQAHRANADRAVAELASARTRAASATATAAGSSPDPETSGTSVSGSELTQAVQSARVQAVLAVQCLSRTVAVARRLDVVASAQATEEARRLAMAAVPETPRQLLSRVLGNR